MLVCNIPSLNQTGFTMIRREIGMGRNKIYLGLKKFYFFPHCNYTAINASVIEWSVDEIRRVTCVRFLRGLDSNNRLPEAVLKSDECRFSATT